MNYLILFRCALDAYSSCHFPKSLPVVPRIGEKVEVTSDYISHFTEKRFPTTLEVKNVTYAESGVVCELWISKLDAEILKANNINIFG